MIRYCIASLPPIEEINNFMNRTIEVNWDRAFFTGYGIFHDLELPYILSRRLECFN